MVILAFLLGLALGAVFSGLIFKWVAKGRAVAKEIVHDAAVEVEKAKTKI